MVFAAVCRLAVLRNAIAVISGRLPLPIKLYKFSACASRSKKLVLFDYGNEIG